MNLPKFDEIKNRNESWASSIFHLPKNENDKRRNANDELNHVLNLQDQQARISSTNISTNFYTITQYILQAYFKVSFLELRTLKLVDLIVDQTYAESLTLRKLNEGASVRSYEYFNTVPRQEDITRCPIFALATYFVIRWSHPNPPISIENFEFIPLLDPSTITWNKGFEGLSRGTKEGNIVSRSNSFQPADELIDIIFPWLTPLRQDMEIIDRSNYKLHSFLELFEFLARTIIQDLKFLQVHSGLLPNIVTFVAKFIPDLFQHPKFRLIKPVFNNNNNNNHNNHNHNNNNNHKSNHNNHNNNNSIGGEKKDSYFLQLSKRLTTENVRLAQQITQLKTDLSNVQYMCDQILKLQQQQLINNGSNSGSSNIGNNGNGYNNNNIRNYRQNGEEESEETSNLAPMLASFPLINPDINKKRKLPPPQPGLSPFPPSPGLVFPAVTESPYSKRTRIDERPTPSQNVLDLLLAKTVSSPRFPSISANNQRVSSRYSSPNAFAMTGSPNAVLPPNPITLEPRTTQPEAHSLLRNNSAISDTMPTTRTTATTMAPSAATAAQTSAVHAPIETAVSSSKTNDNTNNSLPNTPMVNEGVQESNPNEDAETNIAANDNSKALSPKSAAQGQQPLSSSQQVPPNDTTGNATTTTTGTNAGTSGHNNAKPNKPAEKLGPNRHIKYKLSRENKTIWDLYTEWYIGINGQSSIKSLIETYGLRRWKVSDDSHFFPTRRIIMDYIETECDRGIKLGRFTNPNQSREDIRKIIVGDLEKFRINNGLTLNSLSMYFKNLTRENKEICIFQNFKNWSVRAMTEEEKNKYCKRQHSKESL